MSTGLRAGTNNDGYLQVNGTDVLTALSSGRIGVGTTNPYTTLHVVSSGVEQVRLTKNGAEGLEVFLGNNTDVNLFQHYNRVSNTWVENRQNALRHTFANSGNGNEVFRIESTGNVGIGTTNPSAPLDIQLNWTNGATTNDIVSIGRLANAVKITAGYNDPTTSMYLGTNTSHALSLRTANTDRLTISNAGNVGIGTTNASNLLTLGASGGPVMRLVDTSSGAFSILIGGSNGDLTFSADHGNTGASTNIIFSNDGNQERLRISSTGDVGIGTTNPSTKLNIVGSGYNQINIANTTTVNNNKLGGITSLTYAGDNFSVFQTYASSGNGNNIYYGSADGSYRGVQNHYFYVNASADATTNHSLALQIKSNGNVGIGANPVSKFFVKEGSSSMGFAEYNNGATIWLDGADGDVSGGDYFNISANNSQQLTFGYAGGTSIIMDSSGKLGFSGTSPSFMLDVPRGGATSVDTIRSSATTSGANNRVLFSSYANGGGSPYVKFDAGGTDMIIGQKYNGTTNNVLYLGPGTDIDNGYSGSGGIYVKGDGYVGVNYNQSTTKQQLTVNGSYGIFRGVGQSSVWTTHGGAGTFTTLTIEVYQRDYGSFTFDVKAAGYNNTHFYAVGGGYINGGSPIGGNITAIGYTNNIVSYTLGGGSQSAQSWKITITASANQFVHPSCQFHVSTGGQSQINSSDISITWS